ncbi:polynucleotide adenylyltransferase [Azotosporobacter soli]|uniref:CCA tRNA nucleotidyltransferase n=1 Tax=Azotosporobacter soli TaxID=3055040 RepID=UPI0031FE5DA2
MGDTLELSERTLAETVAAQGGRLYRVGGCVRDALRGLPAKDIDFCVTGMVKKNFKELFPEAKECGKSFPVFLLTVDGVKCEVAFARTERKVGPGYLGFKVSSKPKVTIEEDLFRRDTTINSMAMDCLSGAIIDPYGGREDIERGILRATSEHFSEDPIRALRLAGQAARLGFTVEPRTLALAATVAEELKDEPVERMLAELTKALSEAAEPARFFRVLDEAHLLPVTFGELAALGRGERERALQLLDATATQTSSLKVRFASFGLTLPQEELEKWNKRMTLPGDWLEGAITVGQLAKLLAQPDAETIVTALIRLGRGAIEAADFDCIAKAGALSIPELAGLKAVMQQAVRAEVLPPQLRGREIGVWLRERQVKAIACALEA